MPRRSDTLDGYVLDNMEGSVDQVGFLAHTDTPVAIAGARGIGKAYVARILQTCTGCRPDTRAPVECREFRNRGDAKPRN